MQKWTQTKCGQISWSLAGAVALVLGVVWQAAWAQDAAAPGSESTPEFGDGSEDRVTINVEGGDLSQVLSAFSRQTGKSIVIGPEVDAQVNVRLDSVPWEDALNIVLKPYGYGYREIGDAVVVTKLEQLTETEAKEALSSRVFRLKYLDAAAVKDMITAQLSPRGKWSALAIRGQRGWEYEQQGRGNKSGEAMMRRQRTEDEGERAIEAVKLRSKTIIVVDIPTVISEIEKMLAEVDQRPTQVLIESRFVEVTSDFLQDIGVDFGTGADGAGTLQPEAVNVAGDNGLFGVGVQQSGGSVKPAAFAPETTALSAQYPYDAGLALMFQQLTDVQFQVLLHMLEEDVGANLLSAPRVLTLNDQEATIMVGTKYPIIQSDASGSGNSSTISTSLDYYENIGIQLNVIPQICEKSYIRMIVNPRVRALLSTTAGKTGEEGNISLTEYPVLSTREAETQILVKSGQTVVIGGLIEDQERKTELRVPILGSIPILGRLFRRETVDTDKMDLLIFLTATILSPDADLLDEAAIEQADAATQAAAGKEAYARALVTGREETARRDAAASLADAEQRAAAQAAMARGDRPSSEQAQRRRLAAAERSARAEQVVRERAIIEKARQDAANGPQGGAAPAQGSDPDAASERKSVMKQFPAVPQTPEK